MSEHKPILSYSTLPAQRKDWSGDAVFDWVVASLISIVLVIYLASKAGLEFDGLGVFAGIILVPSAWLIMIIRLSIFRLHGHFIALSGIMTFVSLLLAVAVISNMPRC